MGKKYLGRVSDPKDIATKEYVDGLNGEVKTIISDRGPLPSDVGTPGQRWLDTAHGNVEYTCIAVTVGTPNTYTWLYTGGCNKNLIDNAYFVGGGSQQGGGQFPINQRVGYVVPPGTDYFAIGGGSSVGSTDKYVAVNRIDEYGYVFITISGVEYVCAPGTATPGYTGAGYTIDRWAQPAGHTVTITNSGLVFPEQSDFYQPLETIPLGQVVTYSVLTSSGPISATFAIPATVPSEFVVLGGATVDEIGSLGAYAQANVHNGFWGAMFILPSISVIAAKLELGSKQTIAHQDENGNWVLNEVPNFADELAKCQRYFFNTGPDAKIRIPQTAGYDIYFTLPTPAPMRILPAITVHGFKILYNVDASYNMDATGVESQNLTGCGVQVKMTFSSNTYDGFVAYSYWWLSADL